MLHIDRQSNGSSTTASRIPKRGTQPRNCTINTATDDINPHFPHPSFTHISCPPQALSLPKWNYS